MYETPLYRMKVRAGLFIAVLMAMILALSSCGPGVVVMPKNLDEVPRITPSELKARLDRGQEILIVDARPSGEYAGGHIAGAISVPLAEVASRLEEFPRDQEIVFYCT